MKYVLKKDLPFAKAGAKVEVTINKGDEYPKFQVASSDLITFYIVLSIDNLDLQELISEGWVEEVKPREFWVPMESDRILESNCPFDEEYNKNWMGGIEVIKVREIIE